jgi:hypothetical protein
MYLRASELGWTIKEFEQSTWRRFHWEWEGYLRRIERTQYAAAREIVAIVRNVNVKKKDQKRADKIFPLSIDITVDFTFEDAKKQFEDMKRAGWLKHKMN